MPWVLTSAFQYRTTSACTYVSRNQNTMTHPSKSSQTPFSSIDDPLTWGVLPLRYHFNPNNHRWSLGSYDIVFKNKCAIFSTLPQILCNKPNKNSTTEQCQPSSSWAKSFPPTASTKTHTADPFNPPSAKPSACSPVLLSPLQAPPYQSIDRLSHPTSQTPSLLPMTTSPTPPTAPTPFPRPLHTQRDITAGSMYSPKDACISTHIRRCGISNGALRA